MDISVVSVDSLTPDPFNARKHSKKNLDAIASSLKQFGQRRPIVVDSSGTVIAGNGTLQAAKSLGWAEVSVTVFPFDDPVKARAYGIADNRTAELAEWDHSVLAGYLEDLNLAGMLEFTGFTEDELLRLDSESKDVEGQGALLALTDVTVDEPDLEVNTGDVWWLSIPDCSVEHVLCVAPVMTGWDAWKDFLEPGAVFLPYPDPFVTASEIALEKRLVLVQPDIYLAAHVLEKHCALFGPNSVGKMP